MSDSWSITHVLTGEEVACFATSELAFEFIQDDIITHWKSSKINTADEWCELNMYDLCESYKKDKNYFEGGRFRAKREG